MPIIDPDWTPPIEMTFDVNACFLLSLYSYTKDIVVPSLHTLLNIDIDPAIPYVFIIFMYLLYYYFMIFTDSGSVSNSYKFSSHDGHHA